MEKKCIEELRFTCPECGSHEFGTSGCTGPLEEMLGHCHGNGCRFEWPRDEDDRYMTGEPVLSDSEGVYKPTAAMKIEQLERSLLHEIREHDRTRRHLEAEVREIERMRTTLYQDRVEEGNACKSMKLPEIDVAAELEKIFEGEQEGEKKAPTTFKKKVVTVGELWKLLANCPPLAKLVILGSEGEVLPFRNPIIDEEVDRVVLYVEKREPGKYG